MNISGNKSAMKKSKRPVNMKHNTIVGAAANRRLSLFGANGEKAIAQALKPQISQKKSMLLDTESYVGNLLADSTFV